MVIAVQKETVLQYRGAVKKKKKKTTEKQSIGRLCRRQCQIGLPLEDSCSHQPPFPEMWDNLPPPVQSLPDNSAIFPNEAIYITLALYYYRHVDPGLQDVVVYFDAVSCLQAVEGKDAENPLICHIMNKRSSYRWFYTQWRLRDIIVMKYDALLVGNGRSIHLAQVWSKDMDKLNSKSWVKNIH